MTFAARHSIGVLAMWLACTPVALAQHAHGHSTVGEKGPTAASDSDKKAAHEPGMDHSKMDHSQVDHSASPPDAAQTPRTPIPALTDADRAAAFPTITVDHADLHPRAFNTYVLVDRLEAWDADPGAGQAWELSAWAGGDVNRLWLRSEGERERSHTESSEIELLYGRSVSAWWDLVAGVRHVPQSDGARDWAVLAVQGMAPYKFEVSASLYVGPSGRVAAAAEVEYELLLTQRLILQPRIEARLAARDAPADGEGSGLQKVEAGLRLRYEINRHFAPYVGLVREQSFGRTADYTRAEGEPDGDTRVVAGIRVWF